MILRVAEPLSSTQKEEFQCRAVLRKTHNPLWPLIWGFQREPEMIRRAVFMFAFVQAYLSKGNR